VEELHLPACMLKVCPKYPPAVFPDIATSMPEQRSVSKNLSARLSSCIYNRYELRSRPLIGPALRFASNLVSDRIPASTVSIPGAHPLVSSHQP
jgi:hypothetical protein